jgi:hypothetical protein
MFCPRCSQEQVSEETKFCSRCGFQLSLVSQMLAHGGVLPQLAELHKGRKLFSRRNGLIFSLFWFMFFVLIMTPFFGIVNADELAGIAAIFGTMGGLILLIASFVLLKNEPSNTEFYNQKQSNSKVKNLFNSNRSNQTALPPQQSQPAQNYVSPANSWKAPDTGDLAQPHSVTDHTTKLLKKDR